MRVQSLRRAKGLTMEQLATACGVTRGTIHKLEHPSPGEDVSLATLVAITKICDTTLDELFKNLSDVESFKVNASHATRTQATSHSQERRWFQQEDYLAVALLPETHVLQAKADLCEQACLHSTDPQQLDILAKHAAKLRHLRFQITSKK